MATIRRQSDTRAPIDEKALPDFVAVIGLHRSGSSCLASVLHTLGVHMGDRLGGYEKTGGFEARGLAQLCRTAYPFPATELCIEPEELDRRLSNHILHVRRSAAQRGKIAGGKYPHLCAMGERLQRICGRSLRCVHASRPLEASIRSFQNRLLHQHDFGHIPNLEHGAECVQRWLWKGKEQFLATVDHLTIDYETLLSDPRRQIDRIIEYLELQPTKKVRELALARIQPKLCHYVQR